jgi:hypothetical protein
MSAGIPADYEADIKRVGRSGQISLGKEHTGQYFREERRPDGSILLVPVVVIAQSHWTVRDEEKIRKALEWAAETPPKETNLDDLLKKAKAGSRKRRAR